MYKQRGLGKCGVQSSTNYKFGLMHPSFCFFTASKIFSRFSICLRNNKCWATEKCHISSLQTQDDIQSALQT